MIESKIRSFDGQDGRDVGEPLASLPWDVISSLGTGSTTTSYAGAGRSV